MVHAGLNPTLPGVLAMVEERDKAPSLLIQLAHRSMPVSGVHVHSWHVKSKTIYEILHEIGYIFARASYNTYVTATR